VSIFLQLALSLSLRPSHSTRILSLCDSPQFPPQRLQEQGHLWSRWYVYILSTTSPPTFLQQSKRHLSPSLPRQKFISPAHKELTLLVQSPSELRRRREEAQVEIRKQKREESVAKRRNFNAPSSGADSDEEGGADSSVRVSSLLSYSSSGLLTSMPFLLHNRSNSPR